MQSCCILIALCLIRHKQILLQVQTAKQMLIERMERGAGLKYDAKKIRIMKNCYYCGVPDGAIIERGQTAHGKVWRHWRNGDNSDTWRYSLVKESVDEYISRRRVSAMRKIRLIQGVDSLWVVGRNDDGYYGYEMKTRAFACRVCAKDNTNFKPAPKVKPLKIPKTKAPKTSKVKAPKKEQKNEQTTQLTIYD